MSDQARCLPLQISGTEQFQVLRHYTDTRLGILIETIRMYLERRDNCLSLTYILITR